MNALQQTSTTPYRTWCTHRSWIALVEKGVAFSEINVDLTNKPAEFLDLYKELCPDPTARAKVICIFAKLHCLAEECHEKRVEYQVPILEVGERGSSEYFGMIESGAVSEFVAAAFDGGSPLRPANPRLETRMRLFMQCYAEGMQAGQTGLMMCSDEASAAAAYDKLCAGMVAANACLLKHGSGAEGSFLLGKDFSLAECLSAPFVIRARTALKVPWHTEIRQRPCDTYSQTRSIAAYKGCPARIQHAECI